ncbi:MAG: PAS domain S-box protein [Desulfuromonadales bacterium]|nr:PAS domain S-box protein [Desulfuromonadales bacterium]
MSIRIQLIVVIMLMTLMPMCLVAYIAVKHQQEDIEEAIALTASVANQIQNDQKTLLAGAAHLAATLSLLPVVQERDTTAVNALLTKLIKTSPDFSNVIIMDKTGSLWASAIPPIKALSYADRRYFKNALASGRISSGEFTIGKISQSPALSFAYPIKDSNGAVSDVMAIVFSLERYRQFYSGEKATPASSILLVDHKGTILYSSVDLRLVGKQDRSDLFARMKSGPDQGSFEANGNLGIRRIFSYRKLWLKGESSPYMYVRTGLNKDLVVAQARKGLMLGAGILLPIMLIMLGLAICFCKRTILNKVSALQEATQRIAGGDLTVRVPYHISGGELGELGGAFNDMAHRLQLAYDAQRESEEKYRELVENAGSIILKLDTEGRIIFFNEYAERFFGFTEAEILGRNVIGTIVPETESTGRNLAELIRRIFEDPEAYIHNINENTRKNGERVWISWSNHVFVDSSGVKSGILSIGQDITEQRRIEEKLKKSEQRFRSFVENANDIVFALTSTGEFIYVSPNWTDVFGYEVSETVGRSFVPFVHPDDVPASFAFMQQVFETGQKQSGVEYRVLCKNGAYLWYKANASLLKDPDTDAVSLIGIGRDITERKQSEDKFSSVFHGSPDAIILSRFHDGMVLDVNQSFTRITGYTADQVIGKTSHELGVWNDYNERAQFVAGVIKHGEMKCFEANFKTRDGSMLLGQVSGRTIEIDGILCLLSIIRDITEREYILKELIKAQKLESISVLAGGIAHNFNNVLTGVIGYISYAKKHLGESGKVLQILDAAEKSSYRAASIARQLLTFSQGDLSVRKTISVDSLVQESVSLFLSGSNIKGDIDCASQQTISVDSQQISQAFNNIVLNAIHSMPDGGTLKVRVNSISLNDNNIFSLKPGKYVKIVFKDSGCGINKDALAKVFDPYFTTKDSGTGLGLSTTYSIISKHDGHIDIASEVGKGTAVTILLPVSPKKLIDDENFEGCAADGQTDGSILVMDDEEMIRTLMEKMLSDLGYEVTTCSDGEEAAALYKEFRDAGKTFSLVILDLSIPNGVGGIETAQRILGLDPQARLIASSGYSNDPVIVGFREFGFCGSIAKPFSINELDDAIKNVFKAPLP